MSADLMKNLSIEISGSVSDPSLTYFDLVQHSNDQKYINLEKDHFLVDPRYSLSLDEII
jgi:hypothetical protein